MSEGKQIYTNGSQTSNDCEIRICSIQAIRVDNLRNHAWNKELPIVFLLRFEDQRSSARSYLRKLFTQDVM